MTGNDDHSLFRIIRRYGQIPWRGSYRLSHLFLNFYFLVMGSFIIIAFAVDVVISIALKGLTDDYTRRFMRGTIVLIEEDLFRQPFDRWPEAIEALDKKFAYNLDIVDRGTLNLSAEQAQKLDSGGLAIAVDGETLYHRLKQTSKILIVGPLSTATSDPHWQRGIISPELRTRLLVWGLVGLFIGIVVWLWIRPTWRDLEALRQTARALGEGNLEARAPEAVSGTFTLLTETVNGMAERIQHLIATRKALSTSISHELRTPIARMRFALEMLSDADDKAERARLIQGIGVDADELDNLVNSSLIYARYEHRQLELNLTRVQFASWLDEKVDSIRILARELKLTVNTQEIPPGQEVEIDRWSMPYAITNLLRNAIKYAKSEIVVSAGRVGDRVRVHVDDDGPGIPPSDRTQIFHPFTRLDRSRDRATGGYGLGLAITREVLKLHKGTASVSDSPLLCGARFTLEWPITHALSPRKNSAAK